MFSQHFQPSKSGLVWGIKTCFFGVFRVFFSIFRFFRIFQKLIDFNNAQRGCAVSPEAIKQYNRKTFAHSLISRQKKQFVTFLAYQIWSCLGHKNVFSRILIGFLTNQSSLFGTITPYFFFLATYKYPLFVPKFFSELQTSQSCSKKTFRCQFHFSVQKHRISGGSA